MAHNKLYERKLQRLRRVRKGLRGLREGLNTKELEERYLKYLPDEGQRNELANLMIPESQVVLRQKLAEKEYENLRHILQIVKKNRQQVHQVLLYAFSVLLSLLFILGLIFKGPLFAEFLGNRAEHILGAPVTISQPRFRLNGTFEYQSIGIAKPYYLEDAEGNSAVRRKVIEFGPGALKVSWRALLTGKLWLDTLLGETLELHAWEAPGNEEREEPDLQAPLPLSFAGIIAEAQRSFASLKLPSMAPVAGATWEKEIARIQVLINQNYSQLAAVAPNQVTPNNSQQLEANSRELSQRLEGQISDANNQVQAVEAKLAERNLALRSLNAAFNRDVRALQGRLLGGNVLQAPLLYMLEFYLQTNLANFSEISLWLAAVLKNLQQYLRTEQKQTQKQIQVQKNSVFFPDSIAEYRYPAMIYPDFQLEYFEGGWQEGQQHNLKIANLSSDGNVIQAPVVAEYSSSSYGNNVHLKLLHENRQLSGNRAPRRECDVFGIDICDTSQGSHAVFTTKRSEFQVSRELLSQAGLDFIRSYGGDLDAEFVLREANEPDLEANLFVELRARLSEVNLLTSGDINVLQEELIGVLADYPLEIQASFYLNEASPKELLQLKMSSNITEILSASSRNKDSFQNTVVQLNSRLTQDFRNTIQPLQLEINQLAEYRRRLQLQASALAQQKANADNAPQLIRGKAEQQQLTQQNFRYLQPESGGAPGTSPDESTNPQ